MKRLTPFLSPRIFGAKIQHSVQTAKNKVLNNLKTSGYDLRAVIPYNNKKPQRSGTEGIGVLVWCWALLMVIMGKDGFLIIIIIY